MMQASTACFLMARGRQTALEIAAVTTATNIGATRNLPLILGVTVSVVKHVIASFHAPSFTPLALLLSSTFINVLTFFFLRILFPSHVFWVLSPMFSVIRTR
jgi:hypothetical protein